MPEPARIASIVGAGSIAIGAALLKEPARAGAWLGLSRATDVRTVAAIDIAVGTGLLVGQSPWRWMTGRAGANLLIASLCQRRGEASWHRTTATSLLVGLTVVDGRTAAQLHRLSTSGEAFRK